MKVKVEAHVTPWHPPEKVHFDEGLKLPVGYVDREIVKFLCRNWLDDVCTQAGMTCEVVFDIVEDKN